MSTVQNLFNDLQYQIGDEPDILSLINRAIWVIGKRLYWLGSELITAEMSVPVYATVTKTAATIAFVNSDPDTITDSGSGFVTAGFDVDMPITTTQTSNLGPFHVETVAAGTLTLNASDALTAVSAGSSYTITSDDAYGFLPSDFWGLIDKPYINGKDWPLLPLPSVSVALQYTSAGEPRYYKIKGTSIYMTPHTSTDISVKADYFQKPTKLTLLDDDLPWNNLFDDVIYELVLRIFKKGTVLDPGLINFVNDAVDLVAAKREKKGPSEANVGLNYDDYI